VSLACRARGGGRASIATWLFIAFAASCAAAASGAPTVAASGPSEPPPGVAPLEPASALAHDGGAACGEPSCCPHGALVDPHRGFVRCLAAGEDAGPGAPRDAGDAGSGDAGDAAPAGVPAVAEVKTIKLQGGEIPKHEKTIGALMAGVAKCVSEHGGLTAKAGSLKLELLVRARGKAEGVEVRELKGAGAAAATCVRTHVRGRTIGTPTSDPVGVTVQIELKKK
jgi:hypothetical protein